MNMKQVCLFAALVVLALLKTVVFAAQIVYVDASVSRWDSQNGTRDYPYRTIQQGINVVDSNGMVVVASGTYNESVAISGKPVRILSSGCVAWENHEEHAKYPDMFCFSRKERNGRKEPRRTLSGLSAH